MARIFKRNIFLHVNQMQKNFLYPVLLPCLCGCILILLALDYFYFDRGTIIYTYEFRRLKVLILLFLVTLSLMQLFITFSIYYVSNKVIGPYERIIKELDEVIAGKRKKRLVVRKGDKMFAGLLIRINALIEKLP